MTDRRPRAGLEIDARVPALTSMTTPPRSPPPSPRDSPSGPGDAPVPSDGTPPTAPGASPASTGTLPKAAPVPTDPASVAALLERAGSADFERYDPRAVIDAVNALVALGPDDAWRAIEASLAGVDLAADPRPGLFLVLRTAFDAELHPPLLLGESDPPPPPDAGAVPRFPVALVDDVPLLLVSRYTAGGVVEPVSTHLVHYRATGTLRAKPLAPGTDADRLAAVTAVYRTAYGADPPEAVSAFVLEQLRRAGFPIKGPE
jgi:hypothetical protein